MPSFYYSDANFLPQDSVILTAQWRHESKARRPVGANLTAENLCDADLSDANLEGGSAVYGGL